MATQSTLPALQVQQQQQPDLLQKYSQLMALKNSQQQQQMMQQEAPARMQILNQQAQSGQIENQQRQLQLRDAQTLQSISPNFVKKDPSGKAIGYDFDGFLNKAEESGVSPQILSTLQKGFTEAATAKANLTKAERENQDAITAEAFNHLQSLQGIQDPGQRQQVWASIVPWIQKNGASLGVNTQQIPQQPPDDSALSTLEATLGMHAQQLADAGKVGDQKHTEAATAQALAAPVQAATNEEETKRHNAELEKQGNQRVGIEGARLRFQESQAGVSPNGTPNPLAQAIATGHIVPDRMGYLLTKNPSLIQGVMAVDPSFDVSKAQSYPTTYKDFTSGKTSIALNAGGTALTHLQELSAMNTDASHIPGTPAYNAYQNKADTVASELAKFYGDATIPAIASIKKTLTATLPGNRQAAIETQAKSMGDKLDAYQQTWDNAAPSKVYQAPMPGISPKAMAARSALDPTYKAPSASGGAGGTVTMRAPNGQTMPVPADQVDHYKSKGATVVQ